MDMWLYRATRALRPVFGLHWSFTLEGELDAVPRRGPCIVAANHVSFLDPWYICLLFPRKTRFMVTRNWFYRSKLWSVVFRGNGCFPVSAEGPDASVGAACDLLAEDKVIGVFPEGRISHTGRLNPFRTGISYLAARSGVPVVPIGIRGAFESLPRTRRFPRRGPITLRVGAPMRFPGSPSDAPPSVEAVTAFRDDLYRAIAELSGQPVGDAEVPSAPPFRKGRQLSSSSTKP